MQGGCVCDKRGSYIWKLLALSTTCSARWYILWVFRTWLNLWMETWQGLGEVQMIKCRNLKKSVNDRETDLSYWDRIPCLRKVPFRKGSQVQNTWRPTPPCFQLRPWTCLVVSDIHDSNLLHHAGCTHWTLYHIPCCNHHANREFQKQSCKQHLSFLLISNYIQKHCCIHIPAAYLFEEGTFVSLVYSSMAERYGTKYCSIVSPGAIRTEVPTPQALHL